MLVPLLWPHHASRDPLAVCEAVDAPLCQLCPFIMVRHAKFCPTGKMGSRFYVTFQESLYRVLKREGSEDLYLDGDRGPPLLTSASVDGNTAGLRCQGPGSSQGSGDTWGGGAAPRREPGSLACFTPSV